MSLRVFVCLFALLVSPLSAAPLVFQDDAGKPVRLAQPAQRIVSLAPHITELLYAAGVGHRIVGAVQYSDFPPAARRLPMVGGYSAIDLEAVLALHPDLVIGWHSGNPPAALDKLRALGIPVYENEPRSLDDVATSLARFGELAGSKASGNVAAQAFRQRRAALATRYQGRSPVPVFYAIWNQPLMTINDHHLISDVIRLCGGRNVFGTLAPLSPVLDTEAVLAANPEAIVASGMDAARPEWLDAWRAWPQLRAVRDGNLFFVPPDLIQRHTPRVLDGAQQLCEQLERARSQRRPRTPS